MSSPTGSTSASGVPGSSSPGSSMMPPWSCPSSSSRSDRIIPSETSPRSFRFSIVNSPPGITPPGTTTATVAPAPKFQAPQTIERGSLSPTSTFVSCSLSALGCFPASSTRPTRKWPRLSPVSGTPRRTMRSTSQLVKTRRRASSSSGRSKSTYSRSQLTGTFTPLELSEDAEVVFPDRAQVREAVPQHRDPLDAEAERKPLPLRRIEPDVPEDDRVDPARAAHLDPAGVLADAAAAAAADEAGDVELDRRLREREVARPHPHLPLRAEEPAEEFQHCPLQVGERDAAVDGQALDLQERRRVGRIGRVAAVAPSGRHEADRR